MHIGWILAATVLTYAAPSDPEVTAMDRVDYSQWSAGQVLYVAQESAVLRRTPGGTPLKSPLRFGETVTVTAVGAESVRHQERVNRWYAVTTQAGRTGFVFGGGLSPFRYQADFDGDGVQEQAIVTFTPEFKIQVRLLSGVPKSKIETLDLEAAGGAYLSQRGGNARVTLLQAKEAGVALLQVDSEPEACADYRRYYVSYDGTKKKAPRLQEALGLYGLADPPNHQSFEVKLDPVAKRAVVIQTQTHDTETGQSHHPTRFLYHYKKGRYHLESEEELPSRVEPAPTTD